MGSYVASVAEEDFHLAEDFARAGLQANPDDRMLANNLVVALANQDRLDEAREWFARIPRPGQPQTIEGTLLATEGLLKFRSGDLVKGRELYLEAMRNFEDGRHRALAAVHLAREEVISGSREAEVMMRLAEAASSSVKYPEITLMLQRLRRRLEAR